MSQAPSPPKPATVWTRLHGLANPHAFAIFAARATPWFWGIAAAGLGAGLIGALVLSPIDYQQKDAFRISHIHVPSAWMAMFIYVSMAVASGIAMIYRHPLADVAAKASAPIGTVFTALALITGMFWGASSWGTWWAWDARTTSVLLLLFLYVGYLMIWEAVEEPQRAARLAGIVALVGVINIPIIHFSVDWWNTLHQKTTILRVDGPRIPLSMLWPWLSIAIGFTGLYAALLMVRMRTEIIERRLRILAMGLER